MRERATGIGPMMLAIETATEACSVALGDATRAWVDHRVAPRAHNRLVLEMIDGLLARAGVARHALTGLAIGRGPGSFTGVRIAASVAQGIALALDLRVACVSTLEVLAHGAWRAAPSAAGVVVVIGATASRRHLAAFEVRAGALVRVVDDCTVSTTAPLPGCIESDWVTAGADVDGLVAAARVPGVALRPSGVAHPSAADLLALGLREVDAGRAVDGQFALPVYLDGDGPWRKRI